MTTITLDYVCDVGAQDPVAAAVTIAAIPLDATPGPTQTTQGELALLGMTVNSDTTAAVAGTNTVRRTVVLAVGVQGNELFPTDDEKKAATRNLWTDRLGKMIPAVVTASEPVVAP